MSEYAHDPGTDVKLRERVKLAAEAYEHAKAEAQLLLDTAWYAGRTPDGTFAIVKATRIQRHATTRYAKALAEYSAFLLAQEVDQLPQAGSLAGNGISAPTRRGRDQD